MKVHFFKWSLKTFFLTSALACLAILGYILVQSIISQKKSTLFELDQSDKILVKYRLENRKSSISNLSYANLPQLEKNKVSEEQLEYQKIQQYYDTIAREYAVEDSLSDNHMQKILEQEEQDSLLGKTPPLQPALKEENLNSENTKVLTSLRSLKVLHKFDGTTSSKLPKSIQKQEDKIALQFDEEYANQFKSAETYLEEKSSSLLAKANYERSLKQLTIYARNKFYTSPPPIKTHSLHPLSALQKLRIIMGKPRYYRFEIVRMNLVARTEIKLDDLKIYLKRGSYLVPNVGGKHDAFFKYKRNTIYANFAMGYNPSPGKYTLLVRSKSYPDWEGVQASFLLLKRKVPLLKKGFSIANLEYTANLKSLKIRGPDMKVGGYEQIIKWAKFMDTDALWMLAAQTTGWDKSTTPNEPWLKGGFRNLALLAPIGKKENLSMGAYVMSYFTPMNGKQKAGYSPSLGYNSKNGKLQDSLHISLIDTKRLEDIVRIVKRFQEDPNVSFIGLDFIRTGRADGYEMAEQVIDDMNITTPSKFSSFSRIQKIKWFASKVEQMRNVELVTKWRWWRAHQVASIVNRVIQQGKITKPLWVFTLGWEHGKQHGQDPYMFFDAGAFIDAVMLYEANRIQFRNMMVQWPDYMRDNQNNIVIGNATDIRFLDSTMGNTALEYIFRTQSGYRKVYRKGLARGIFMHDISRALWSSKRGLDISEWAMTHGYATSTFRYELGLIPYRGKIEFSKGARKNTSDYHSGTITVENPSRKTLENISLRVVPALAWNLIEDNAPLELTLGPGQKRTFQFRAKLDKSFQKKESLLGYYLHHKRYPRYFFFDIYSKRDLQKYTSSFSF